MVTLFVKGQLNHMVKILAVEFLFVRSRRQNRRSLLPAPPHGEQRAAMLHGCMVVRGAHVHSAVFSSLMYSVHSNLHSFEL
jgi:hypothetical protein